MLHRIVLEVKIAINSRDGQKRFASAVPENHPQWLTPENTVLRQPRHDHLCARVPDVALISREPQAAIKQSYLTLKTAGVWAGDN